MFFKPSVYLRLVILCVGLVTTITSFAASRFYRYEDENGVRVIRDTIPPGVVHKGYDILGSDGRLIQSVPRALTKGELEALEATKESREMLAEERAKQETADKKLLTIFSTPKDAERARDRKIEALEVVVSVNRGNIVRLQSEYDQTQQQAAGMERAGKEVPDHLVEKMERVARQIRKLQETIDEKEVEKEQVRAEYARDIERLKELMREQGRLVDEE